MNARARYVSLMIAWIVLVVAIAWSAAATQQLVREDERQAEALQADVLDQLCMSLLNDFEVLEAIELIGPGDGVQFLIDENVDNFHYFCGDWVQPNLRPDFDERLAAHQRKLDELAASDG